MRPAIPIVLVPVLVIEELAETDRYKDKHAHDSKAGPPAPEKKPHARCVPASEGL